MADESPEIPPAPVTRMRGNREHERRNRLQAEIFRLAFDRAASRRVHRGGAATRGA